MKRLLLTLALCMSLFAGGFLLTIQNGSICYREPGGAWHDTGLRAQHLARTGCFASFAWAAFSQPAGSDAGAGRFLFLGCILPTHDVTGSEGFLR